MSPRIIVFRTFALVALGVGFVTIANAADQPDTLVRTSNPERYQISVSATKLKRRTEDVPNSVSIVTGEELQRRGTRTLAEALQDVAGLDTGEGSDNGPNVPNVGLWGLKEFDALLFTVDGVPVGGPFNPSLTQIPVNEIDHIEVVRGPQSTLYGVSAFAGMVQVFTRDAVQGMGQAMLGVGSFGNKHAQATINRSLADGSKLLLSGFMQRSDLWQDRTTHDEDRGRLMVSHDFEKWTSSLDINYFRNTQFWGSPLPHNDEGEVEPGFEIDKNYAVQGARLDHHVFSANLGLEYPVREGMRVRNTFGIYTDSQISVRSFVEPDAAVGNVVPSQGVNIRPKETAIFDELRYTTGFQAQGRHDLVAGGSVTYGKTTADGEGFDFDQTLGDASSIPDVGAIPPGDLRSFKDARTYLAVFARDEWTPVPMFTLSGGGHYDNTSETLHAQAQEQGPPLGPLEVSDDDRTEHAWTGDLSGLVRMLKQPLGELTTANLYANWKSAFKPAAPNLSEAESAEILDPEWTHSVEAGLKARGWGDQVSVDFSWFDMKFENMVVSALDPSNNIVLVNAGSQRFKGIEVDAALRPNFVPGSTLALGYGHHDAKFVHFTNPDGVTVDGNKIELVPEDLFNARLDLRMKQGFGVFGALRWQGERPSNEENTGTFESFTEYDAGASYHFEPMTVSFTGHNLGDDRHPVAESELGDLQFYMSAPRRFTFEVSTNF